MNIHNLFDLTGKTALVTGCSRGIGKAIAEGLAHAGADIIGVSVSSPLGKSEVAQNVEKAGKKFFPFQVDFSERQQLYAFLEKLDREFNQIDILINNAGAILRKPAAEHPDEYWDRILSINLDAQFILSREIGKKMLKAGSGKIIFTASLLTFQGGINVPGYTASKSAIGGLIKALANEWAASGIHVNGIAPGYVDTDNTEALRNDPVRSKSILERIPAGRWGTPEDFIGPAIFLSSSASDYVNGTILTVDGGWMSR